MSAAEVSSWPQPCDNKEAAGTKQLQNVQSGKGSQEKLAIGTKSEVAFSNSNPVTHRIDLRSEMQIAKLKSVE